MRAKLHKLNKPKGANRYCGPAVISFLTGCSTDEAAWLVRRRTGAHAVRGMFTHDLVLVLRMFGLGVEPVPGHVNKTLAGFLRDTVKDRGRDTYLVVAGNHFQIVRGTKYACGRVGGIVSIRDKKVKRRCRVQNVYRVTGTAKRPDMLDHREWQLKERASLNARMSRARAKAKKAGITVETDIPGSLWYVTLPDACYDSYGDKLPEFEDVSGFAYSREELIDLLEAAAEAVTQLDEAA